MNLKFSTTAAHGRTPTTSPELLVAAVGDGVVFRYTHTYIYYVWFI